MKRRDPKPGELRAIARVEQLWRVADDPAARLDLSRAVSKLSHHNLKISKSTRTVAASFHA